MKMQIYDADQLQLLSNRVIAKTRDRSNNFLRILKTIIAFSFYVLLYNGNFSCTQITHLPDF